MALTFGYTRYISGRTAKISGALIEKECALGRKILSGQMHPCWSTLKAFLMLRQFAWQILKFVFLRFAFCHRVYRVAFFGFEFSLFMEWDTFSHMSPLLFLWSLKINPYQGLFSLSFPRWLEERDGGIGLFGFTDSLFPQLYRPTRY